MIKGCSAFLLVLPQKVTYFEIRVKSTETANLVQIECQISLKCKTSLNIPQQLNAISNYMFTIFMVVRRLLRLGLLDQIFSLVGGERKCKGRT